MQKFKVNGQSVPQIEWKQTDGHWTDKQTEAIALPPTPMRLVINTNVNSIISLCIVHMDARKLKINQ